MIRYGMNASRSEVTAVPRGQHSTFTALLFPAPHHVPVTLQVPEVTSEAAETSGRPRLGIGMDASVTPIPDMAGTSLAQTTDFFYPLVDDPYLQVGH